MAQDKKEQKSELRQKTLRPTADRNNDLKRREKREKENAPTKVVVRRLPPSLSPEEFLEQIAPVPEHTDFYFCRPDMSLGSNAVSRAYINFAKFEDICLFREKFDGYVFLDSKGNEYPVVVEFAPYQKCAKKKAKKPDPKKGTIEQDPDYIKFLESLENPEDAPAQTIENLVEEIETKEREQKASAGVKSSTPLLDYLKRKKEERRAALQRMREERKRKEQEKKNEDHDIFLQKLQIEMFLKAQLLKNPDRDKGRDSEKYGRNTKEDRPGQEKSPVKETSNSRPQSGKERDRERNRPGSSKKDSERKDFKDTKKDEKLTEKEKSDATQPGPKEDKSKPVPQTKKDEKPSEASETREGNKGATDMAAKRIGDENSKGSDSSGKEEGAGEKKERRRYKDRPERAIYVPGRRRQEIEKQKKEPEGQGQGES
ncbi:regulator of nonsense transcripts 3A [Lingula anatina]|uniref:Regulator of nonsense transcripts 3A n=1 Tax=Lingula anatina TaxID=7574 RepID=A0A1S3KB58_LINAN|nr:regulator of nonsense transcripts 3A [Lingula anatina]|eukprot:XP_013419669.1 regulator of nonsense transcripts 3A [Lingula anatina]